MLRFTDINKDKITGLLMAARGVMRGASETVDVNPLFENSTVVEVVVAYKYLVTGSSALGCYRRVADKDLDL